MKKLTIKGVKERFSKTAEFTSLEKKFKISFPKPLKRLLLQYEGCHTLQHIYLNQDIFYSINNFLYIKEHSIGACVEAILGGHEYYGDHGYIPFAIDAGGWDFNVSIRPETLGQIWINKFDSGEENPFEFVCENLETFINGLMTTEEAVALGY